MTDHKPLGPIFFFFCYTFYTPPITDHIGIARIAKHTSEDRILQDLRTHVENGQTWIPKDNKELSKFATILPEITVTGMASS